MMTLRKTLYTVFCLLMGVCTLSGCIEKYEADIAAEDSNLLVVEGTICASQLNTFILSRTQAINATHTPGMVTGASVSVRGSDGSEYVAQATDGQYSCWIGDLSTDVEYYLHIETDGEVYESEPQRPLRTEKITVVKGVQSTPESSIDVLVSLDSPIAPEETSYYTWAYDETWEVRSDYTTFWYFDVETMEPVYKDNQFPNRGWKYATGSDILVTTSANYEGHHIQNLKLYDIGRDNERMLQKYSGLIQQRAITKAEYEYELARRQAGTEMGGLFTPQPSSLPTNIHCLTSKKHVIGFVGCSLNTSSYRFFLDPSSYSIYRPAQSDSRKWLEDCNEEDCLKMAEAGMFLCEWQDDRILPGGKLRTAWAFESQLDVRHKGASIEEPDYWSLEEDVSY